MAVKDAKLVAAVANANGFVLDGAASLTCLALTVATAGANQAAVRWDAVRVPHGFEVVAVDAWGKTVTATAQVDVTVNGVSVLSALLTPATGATAPASGALVATRSARRGTAGQEVALKVTTNGTGAFADLDVRVWIRPYPQNGEAQ